MPTCSSTPELMKQNPGARMSTATSRRHSLRCTGEGGPRSGAPSRSSEQGPLTCPQHLLTQQAVNYQCVINTNFLPFWLFSLNINCSTWIKILQKFNLHPPFYGNREKKISNLTQDYCLHVIFFPILSIRLDTNTKIPPIHPKEYEFKIWWI